MTVQSPQNQMLRYQALVVRLLAIMICVSVINPYAVVFAQQDGLYSGHEQGSMRIDLIPGDSNNVVRPSASRVISAVIFGSDRLDVGEINPRTIRLNGVDILLVGKSNKRLCLQKDVDADTILDLLCDIRTTGFRVGEGEYKVILKAATYQGESLQSEDQITVRLN